MKRKSRRSRFVFIAALLPLRLIVPGIAEAQFWTWTQVNNDGFGGIPFRHSAWSMAYFNDDLYVGTALPGKLYRTARTGIPGTSRYRWNQVTLPTVLPDGRSFEPNRIGQMLVLEGSDTSWLYVVTHDDTRDVLFRTSNGSDWELCQVFYPGGLGGHGHGGGVFSSGAVSAMAAHDGGIYIALANIRAATGNLLMCRTSGGIEPTYMLRFEVTGLDIGDREVSCMKSFGDYLYFGTSGSARTVQIWRGAGSTSPSWENVLDTAGPPSGGAQSLEVFNDVLYLGIMGWGGTTPVQLWRSSDGTAWTQVDTSGQFDARRTEIRCLKAFGENFFAGLGGNPADPPPVAQIYKSADGSTWEEITPSELSSDLNNVNVGAMAVAWDALFFGTALNTHSGTEIWSYHIMRMRAPTPTPPTTLPVYRETIPERVIPPPPSMKEELKKIMKPLPGPRPDPTQLKWQMEMELEPGPATAPMQQQMEMQTDFGPDTAPAQQQMKFMEKDALKFPGETHESGGEQPPH